MCVRGGFPQRKLHARNADAFADVTAGHDFIDQCDGVIGIAQHAFAPVVEHKLLAAGNVAAGALAVGAEISGGADVCPLYVLLRAQEGERFVVRGGQRLERVRKSGAVWWARSSTSAWTNPP